MKTFFHFSFKNVEVAGLLLQEYPEVKQIMKFTQNTLDKVEKIVEENGYVIRYERGTFQSGYCILQEKKVVVLNKFLQTEGRINTIIDLIPQLDINFDKLTHESQKLFTEVMAMPKA